MDTQFLTTKQWAAKYNMHPQRVRDLCLKGTIKAVKIGSTYRIPYIDPPELRAEQLVIDAIKEITQPCLETIDAAIESLQKMREAISECDKTL